MATAGIYGIPVVMVSSDEAGCAEAAGIVPGLHTAVTKHGIGRYMGRLLHPSETGAAIASAARKAVEGASEISAWKPDEPVTVKIEFNRSEECDIACQMPGWSRLDAYTIEADCADWPSAHVMSRRAMGMGLTGRENG